MRGLPEEYQEHLEKQVDGATTEEKLDIMQQVHEVIEMQEVEDQWEEVMEKLETDDKDHLATEVKEASLEIKAMMLQQVCVTCSSNRLNLARCRIESDRAEHLSDHIPLILFDATSSI